MAELALALTGVAATAAELAKKLFSLYRSARDAYRDTKLLATNLNLFSSVLSELERILEPFQDLISVDARATIEGILQASHGVFDRIKLIITPYLPRNRHHSSGRRVVHRVAWHSRKGDVHLLTAQLESLKSTTQLMLSVITLASQMSLNVTKRGESHTPMSSGLRRHLVSTGKSIEGQRISIIRLLVIEEEMASLTDLSSRGERIYNTRGFLQAERLARISDWIAEVVESSEIESNSSIAPSSNRCNSVVSLSTVERFVTSLASDDIGMLPDKFTNQTESRSRPAPGGDSQPFESSPPDSQLQSLSHKTMGQSEATRPARFPSSSINSRRTHVNPQAILLPQNDRKLRSEADEPNKVYRFIKAANVFIQLKKYREAYTLYLEALRMKRQHHPDDAETLELQFRLGMTLRKLGEFPLAEQVLQNALAKSKMNQHDSDLVCLAKHYLARVLTCQSKWGEAAAVYEPLWAPGLITLKNDTERSLNTKRAFHIGHGFATVLIRLKQHERAVSILQLVFMKAQEFKGETELCAETPSERLSMSHLRQLEKLSNLTRQLQNFLRKSINSEQPSVQAKAADARSQIREKLMTMTEFVIRYWGHSHLKSIEFTLDLASLLQMEHVLF